MRISKPFQDGTYACGRLHVAQSSVFIQVFFDKRLKHKLTELTVDIKNSLLDALKTVDWIYQSTQRCATIKVKKMTFCVGYPEELLKDNYVKVYYQWLHLDGNEYFWKLNVKISKFFRMNFVEKLDAPPFIKDYFEDHASTDGLKAYYIRNEKSIEMPAGVLQDKLFDPDRP
ncbi:endothelin-converting enzyme-like 1 isoform X2 [Zophobas morio]|uniref:endothelin-converting enzyme-like 1 isoform X2 n=1 Tax=Zophobas morio TaxID=2755281 RepID=UPI00308350E9